MTHDSPTGSQSILGETPTRASLAGKIRSGIKVLKRAVAENATAAKIYRDGMQAGKTYDAIETEIADKTKITGALVPKNTPYFRVSRADFRKAPELADRIMSMYGEDRGDGVQLYRFPVVFALDNWLENLPHGLKAYGQSGLKFWSEYDAAGKRYCMHYAAADMNPQNKRAARVWGGRNPVVREENGGLCDPSRCPEYQSKKCSLSGQLQFYIPGIPGASLIALETTSIYSLKQMQSQMEKIFAIRHGRLSGTERGEAIFYLTKVADEISRLDENGNPTKVKQFLVNLESMMDMTAVMAQREMMALPFRAPLAIETKPSEAAPAVVVEDCRPKPAALLEGEETPITLRKRLRAEVAAVLAEKKIDVTAFGKEKALIHGEHWSQDIEKLRAVLKDLELGL